MEEVKLNDWQVVTLYHYYLKHKELWKRVAEYLTVRNIAKGEWLGTIKDRIIHDMDNTSCPYSCYCCLCVRVDVNLDIKNIFASIGIYPNEENCGRYCIVDWGFIKDSNFDCDDCIDRYTELQCLLNKGLDSFTVLRAVDIAQEFSELPFRYQKRLEQIDGYDPELL